MPERPDLETQRLVAERELPYRPMLAGIALKAIDYALALERERDEQEQKARIAKLWCQRTHMLPICGNTVPDEQSEAIVRSMRAEAGGSPEGGCGRLVEWLMAYRCLECGRWMHAACLRAHFATHGDRTAALERELGAARQALVGILRIQHGDGEIIPPYWACCSTPLPEHAPTCWAKPIIAGQGATGESDVEATTDQDRQPHQEPE